MTGKAITRAGTGTAAASTDSRQTVEAIRAAAAVAMRGASESERRAGTVPASVRRLRGCALRRFADWMDGAGRLPHPVRRRQCLRRTPVQRREVRGHRQR